MTERELERRAQHKLAVLRHVEEVSDDVAATCPYYGINRQCYYPWRRRYEADGAEGQRGGAHLPGNYRARPLQQRRGIRAAALPERHGNENHSRHRLAARAYRAQQRWRGRATHGAKALA